MHRTVTLVALAALMLAACEPKHPANEPAAPPPSDQGKRVIAPAQVDAELSAPVRPLAAIPSVSRAQEMINADYAARGGPPWYRVQPYKASLKAALADELRFLGPSNPGYHKPGDAATCAALKRVGLPCDYNSRGTISMYLTVNGKGLFPAEGGTNPWYTADVRKEELELNAKMGVENMPNDAFVGRPIQNRMLAAAVTRNAHLFHHGDLTAEDVQHHWR